MLLVNVRLSPTQIVVGPLVVIVGASGACFKMTFVRAEVSAPQALYATR